MLKVELKRVGIHLLGLSEKVFVQLVEHVIEPEELVFPAAGQIGGVGLDVVEVGLDVEYVVHVYFVEGVWGWAGVVC